MWLRMDLLSKISSSMFCRSLLLIALGCTLTQGPNAFGIEGLGSLEKRLLGQNLEIHALQFQVESQQEILYAYRADFFPSLSLVGGLQENRTLDLSEPQKGSVGYFDGRLNLFNGFRTLALRDKRRIDLELARLELESKKRELRLQLVEIATDMILAHSLQDILQEEYKVTQTQKQMAEKKVAAGLTSSVDQLEFQLREDEIEIEQKQIEQKHHEAHQRFLSLFGLDHSESGVDADLADRELNGIEFSKISDLLQLPKVQLAAETLLYQKTDLAKQRAEIERNEIKGEFLPSLELAYSYGKLTPSWSGVMSNSDESRYSLLLTMPIFSGFDTHFRTRAAQALVTSSEALKRNKENDLKGEIQNYKTKFLELSQLHEINDKKMRILQRYFDLTLGEYKRGIKNSPDLVGATERLFSTKKKKFELLKDLELLRMKLSYL